MNKFNPFRFLTVALATVLAFGGVAFFGGATAVLGGLAVASSVSWQLLNPAPALLGANATGTLSGTLVLQKALELVFTKRPLLKMISLGFRELDGQVENALKDQAVTTRIQGIPTVNNFGTGATDTADTDVSVTLNQFKEVHHAFTAAEINATDRNLVEEAAEPMAVAIGNHVVDAIAALWIAGNFSNSTTVASGWSRSNTILALKAALDGRGVPDSNRFFAFSTAVDTALQGDSLIVAEQNNARNADAIMKGELPTVSNFAMAPYPAIPTTGNMVGFAGHKQSTVFAARAPKNPEDVMPGVQFPGSIGYVEDPVTGFRVMVNQWIGTDLKCHTRLVFLYGVAAGVGSCGQILKTS